MKVRVKDVEGLTAAQDCKSEAVAFIFLCHFDCDAFSSSL